MLLKFDSTLFVNFFRKRFKTEATNDFFQTSHEGCKKNPHRETENTNLVEKQWFDVKSTLWIMQIRTLLSPFGKNISTFCC